MKEEFDLNKNVIFETPYWKIVLADNQSYLGRSVVILKRHAGSLAELKKEEIFDFLEVAKKLENVMKEIFNATMFNWGCLMNNAYQEAIPKPQVHWHFRPRYRDKVKFDNQIFEDTEFGYHYDSKRKLEVSEESMNKIIKKIKENI